MKTLAICIMTLFLTNIGLGQVPDLPNPFHDYTNLKSENGDLLIENIQQLLEDENWVNNWKHTYSYNVDGNIIEELINHWNEGNWGGVIYSRIYSYDLNGYLVEMIWDHRGRFKVTYSYNVDGKVSEMTIYGWSDDTWRFGYILFFSYDVEGNKIEELWQEWEEENWVNSVKITKSYDVEGNNIEELWQEWEEENWVNSVKITKSYDVDGNNIEKIWQRLDGENWVNDQKWIYNYDTNGFKNDDLCQGWDGEIWVNEGKSTYNYDANGNNIEVLDQGWDGENWEYNSKSMKTWESASTISEQPILVNHYQLFQNYPNPFNPSTTIEFDLPKSSDVRIEVYNTTGQKIQTLLNEKMAAGNHQVEFNAQNLSSGVYYYRIEAGEFVDVKKMVLLR